MLAAFLVVYFTKFWGRTSSAPLATCATAFEAEKYAVTASTTSSRFAFSCRGSADTDEKKKKFVKDVRTMTFHFIHH